MIKLLLGGSPCTKWSIAQTNNRETEPKGEGWELFRNYLIAKEKYKPDYFLYENNKSAAQPIKDQISRELGVDLQYINSSLVSAQNRQRFYAHNIPNVPQPDDRGILLKDILETGTARKEKAYALDAKSVQRYSTDDLYPSMRVREATKAGYVDIPLGECVDLKYPNSKARRGRAMHEKSNCLMTSNQFFQYCGTLERPIFKIDNGVITVENKSYPLMIYDGCYIIRKLTVTECKRLQTVPDSYEFPVSNTQAYKMLGNGWTVDVIAHILSYIPGIREEEIEVLSMYDGMSCGHIALDKLGAKVVRYYATEIDKYAIQTTMANYPDTVQLGNAFGVREAGWTL